MVKNQSALLSKKLITKSLQDECLSDEENFLHPTVQYNRYGMPLQQSNTVDILHSVGKRSYDQEVFASNANRMKRLARALNAAPQKALRRAEEEQQRKARLLDFHDPARALNDICLRKCCSLNCVHVGFFYAIFFCCVFRA